MKGEVRYDKLKIIHIPLVRQEMNFRNIQFEQKWSIKKLVSELKARVISDQQKSILIAMGNTQPDGKDLNNT
eukprot:334674-Ditylum_brightwellii.AAC.1